MSNAASAPVAAVIAVVISLGTTNTFIAGVSRLGHVLAVARWLPGPISAINRNHVPTGGILAVSGTAAAVTLVITVLVLQTAARHVLIPVIVAAAALIY